DEYEPQGGGQQGPDHGCGLPGADGTGSGYVLGNGAVTVSPVGRPRSTNRVESPPPSLSGPVRPATSTRFRETNVRRYWLALPLLAALGLGAVLYGQRGGSGPVAADDGKGKQNAADLRPA